MQVNGYLTGDRYTGNTSAGNSSQGKSTDYMELIANYKKEIFDKVKNNETEEEIQTGGASFTQSKWRKLMEMTDFEAVLAFTFSAVVLTFTLVVAGSYSLNVKERVARSSRPLPSTFVLLTATFRSWSFGPSFLPPR